MMAKITKKKTLSSIDDIPQEIADYLKFLNKTDEIQEKMLTKDRIMKNFNGFGKAFNLFLAYPDLFVDIMTSKHSSFELYFVQRVVLRAMTRHRQSFMTFTRSFSKSFLAFLSRYIYTMLVPHHKAFIVSGTKIQAAQIAKEKVVHDLWVKFPLLENEMKKFRIAGKLQEPYLQGKDYAEFNFTHGGTFDVVGAGSSIRGARRHSGIFEEVIEHDPIEINEHIIPLMNKQRADNFGRINPYELHGSKIYVTTAGYQGTFAYEKLIETICYTVIDPDQYIVLGGSYHIPLMVGLLDEQAMVEVLSSPSFQMDSVDREYRSKWSGAPVGAAFTASKVQELRKIVRAEVRASKSKDKNNEHFYVVTADMAKDGSARTAVMVLKILPKEFSFLYSIVNLFEVNSSNYEEVSAVIKRTLGSFNARLFIYDANGIGAALRDWLNKEQPDTQTGQMLPAYGIINPPEQIKKDLRKVNRDMVICYEVKAVGEVAGHINKIFFSKMGSGNVRFLIKSVEAINKLQEYKKFVEASSAKKKAILRPYFTTDKLEEEMRNLDIVDNSDASNPNNIRVKRRDARIQKDFYSALSYGIYATHLYVEVDYYAKRRKKSRKMSDFIMG
jgi:hypothetical protein